MRKAQILLTLLALLPVIAPAAYAADRLDGDGYPEMYLRGQFDNNRWECHDEYKFTRTGDTYSLHLDALDGQFKIAGTEWNHEYGSPNSKTEPLYTISGSENVIAIPGNGNFNAVGLRNLDISFQMTRRDDGSLTSTTVKFVVDGAEPTVSGLSGTLPVLYINVRDEQGNYDNEVIDMNLDHKNYFAGEYWLDLNGCDWMAAEGAKSIGSESEPLPLEIKARGNWTRKGFSKKPFKLKLGAKQKMLGLTKSKHFAILAHADDSWGYLRNFTGFNLGKRIGLPWTPAQQPVEVVINGNYRGLYFLTESIRIDSDRVDINELDDNATDPGLISGGYLVELDNYDEDNQIRMQEKGCVPGHYMDVLRITWDTPEEYSPIQKQFVTDQFTAMNDAVGACSDDLWKYMDMDDAARYYLVEEIISHTESFHGSTYMFRDRGEGQKWHFSPLWDCGNAFSGATDQFFYDNDPFGNTWIPSIRANASFNHKVEQTWLWFMNTSYEGLMDDIDTYVSHIAEAAKADRRRWKDQPVPAGGQAVVDNSDMESRRRAVVDHLNAKINWLKGHFGDFAVEGVTSEPERDATPAAPLPPYAASAIGDISAGAPASTSAAAYYNLQGIAVSNPVPGQTYIVRRGDTTTKEVCPIR